MRMETGIPEMDDLLLEADHVDFKETLTEKDLECFLADMLSYRPSWLMRLFALRGVLARVLDLDHNNPPDHLTPEDIGHEMGDKVLYFQTLAALPGRFWVGELEDTHLATYFGAVSTPNGQGRNLIRVMTVVHYRNWIGPIYFNIIRPFHYLIVHLAARSAK